MKLKTTDLRLLDEIFEMQGGYVLDFSNQTFSEFFAGKRSLRDVVFSSGIWTQT